MGTGTLLPKWTPQWWNNNYEMSWTRAKEALRRDLEQTKHDLGMGGHELNQSVSNTVAQASGEEAIPDVNHLNPPRVIGSWDEAELPVGFGYGARLHYGATHPAWNDTIARTLESEWKAAHVATGRAWNDVVRDVRRGYDFPR